MENYKEDIIATRKGGLGSSDAAMVEKIGRNGELSQADRYRIAVMLGLAERKQFSTAATQLGDEIEAKVFEQFKEQFPQAVSNPFYKSELLSNTFGFDIFCHIDFEAETEDSLIWVENKATKLSMADTINTYAAQLQWEYMLLQEKAAKIGKRPQLMLSHFDTTMGEWNPELLQVRTIQENDSTMIMKGLRIIMDSLEGFTWEQPEELDAVNLPVEQQEQIKQISHFLQEIKRMQEYVETFKAGMLEVMQQNGVKSIKTEFFGITMVNEKKNMSFDSAKFKKDQPDLYAQYQKPKTTKAYVLINLK